MKTTIVALLGCCLLCSPLVAKNWPQWRGPDGNGVADPGAYPVKFTDEESVAWKVALPGRGSSTPAVWDDQIFVTCPIDGQDGVVCYDFAGNERWQTQLGSERAGKHRNGTGSNPSPVTDGEHLVVYYKSGTIACLDLAGETRWQINLQALYGEDTLWWDLGTSPILAAGNAVVAVMQDGASFLVALDLTNGEIAWKRERVYPCEKESDQSYTTPHVATIDGRDVIVTWGADHLTGHEAASGELLWECGGFNPENKGMWRVIASAAVDNQVAVVPYGRGNFVAGIGLADASGNTTSSHRLWEKSKIGANVPTPVILGEQVILLGDKGDVY
ncbi:MAG: PQQ-binding-like beta-propeller repeat protein, partial [Bythopirellula sp.]